MKGDFNEVACHMSHVLCLKRFGSWVLCGSRLGCDGSVS